MNKPKSKCCNAEMKEVGMPDFIGSNEICTMHFECQACHEPCDPNWQENVDSSKTTEQLIEEMKKAYKIDLKAMVANKEFWKDRMFREALVHRIVKSLWVVAQAAKEEGAKEERGRILESRIIDSDLTQCQECFCMTKTVTTHKLVSRCGKCFLKKTPLSNPKEDE